MSRGRGRFTPIPHLTMCDMRHMNEPRTLHSLPKCHIFCQRPPAIMGRFHLFCSSAGSTTIGRSVSVTLIGDVVVFARLNLCLNRCSNSTYSYEKSFNMFVQHATFYRQKLYTRIIALKDTYKGI